MLRAIVFLLITSCISSWASVDTRKLFTKQVEGDFRAVEDTLCFANYGTGFVPAAGKNPYLLALAHVAQKEGACQGMVGVAAAVKTRVQFRPNRSKMSVRKIKKQINRAVGLHKNNCSGKVYIDGYQDLRDLCQDHETALRRRSLQYNLGLAIKEILPESRTFFFEGPLSSEAKASRHLLRELTSIYGDLLKGEYPLMMVRKHVTLVTGMNVERDTEGYIKTVTLQHYDPNSVLSSERDFSERTYTFSRDGKSISGKLIWNISPRSTKLGCLLRRTDVE